MDAEHKHVLLGNHLFEQPIHNFPVMPFVTKITFLDSVIKNGSILHFRTKFARSVYEDFASTMLDVDDIMPGVKVLTFHFKNSFEKFGSFCEEIYEKFPSLEEFKLILDTTDHESDFEPTWDVDTTYQPTYFKNLVKFSLATFCDIGETDRIFENMDICNAQLEELSCLGVHMSQDNLQWISRCRRLRELTLKCEFLKEDDMNELKGMQSLSQFKLIVAEIEWDPMQIIDFIQSNLQLIHFSIICGPESKKIEFDNDFKMAFDQLTQDRGELLFKLTFNKRGEKQTIKITKDGFVETHVPRADDDSDDDDDDSSFDGDDTDIDEEEASDNSGNNSIVDDDDDDEI